MTSKSMQYYSLDSLVSIIINKQLNVCVCVFLWACCPFSMRFTVSYESMLAYTIKAHPGAFKARTPLNAARSFNYYYFFQSITFKVTIA